MNCTHFRSSFKSADGINDIAYYVRFPAGEVRGIVQIVHGMCEYFTRYDHFAQYLTELGFLVCGNDHLGHGNSVASEEDYGYFSHDEGWENCVRDMYKLTSIIKKSYPDVPYFMFCHSMGSFLGRAYAVKHRKTLDGIIICGTGGPVAGTPALLTASASIKAVKGERHRSKTLTALAFGSYNSRIPDAKTQKDWLSRDEEMVLKNDNDPKCSFMFTINGYENLSKVVWYVNNKKWFENYPKELPSFLIAGTEDPVGNYGEGVKKVFEGMAEQGCDVELKLYEGARHELVNEINKDEVFKDITDVLFEIIDIKNDDRENAE